MKKYETNTSINVKNFLQAFFLTAILFICPQLFAQIKIQKVEGRAFVLQDIKTRELRSGEILSSKFEILTEENALVHFTDSFNGDHYLAEQGHLKIENNDWELINGNIWMSSKNDSFNRVITTANALCSFKNGEGILSYDISSNKTQIFSLRGNFILSNRYESEKYLTNVSAGEFSFFSTDLEEKTPRVPTPIGYNSYNELMKIFKNIKNLGNGPANLSYQDFSKNAYQKVTTEINTANKQHEESRPDQTRPDSTDKKEKKEGKFIFLRDGKISSTINENKIQNTRSVSSLKQKGIMELVKDEIHLKKTSSVNRKTERKNKKNSIPMRVFGKQKMERSEHLRAPMNHNDAESSRGDGEKSSESSSEKLKAEVIKAKINYTDIPKVTPPPESEVKDLIKELESYRSNSPNN